MGIEKITNSIYHSLPGQTFAPGWPTEQDEYRIMQLSLKTSLLGRNPVMLVSPSLLDGHSTMLGRFLDSHGVRYRTELNETGRDLRNMRISDGATHQMPARRGWSYAVVGAGFLTVDENGYQFYSKSRNYEIGINAKHLEEINRLVPLGTPYRIKQ